MILKLFLGTVGPVLLEGLGENKVDKDDKDTDVSDTSVVDVVAAHPTPVNPKAEVRKIPIIIDNTRLQRAAIISCFILPPPTVRALLKVRSVIINNDISNPCANVEYRKNAEKQDLSKDIDEYVSTAYDIHVNCMTDMSI
jgi:hypothetical protein